LKLKAQEELGVDDQVSNPWREAIEACRDNCRKRKQKFPILGGRLLKPTTLKG